MEHLAVERVKGAFGLLHDLSEERLDLEAFAGRGIAGLPTLVASELTTLSICDLAQGKRTVFSNPTGAIGRDELAVFDRFFSAHPLVRYHAQHPHGATRRISDSVPDHRFHRTALYNDYYRRLRIEHVMAMPLFVDRRLLISFVVQRGGRDFDDTDRQLLDLMRPQLGTLFRHALLLERGRVAMARLEHLSGQEGWCMIGIDETRCVRRLSDRAGARLAICCPGEKIDVGRRLPGAVDRWVVETLADPRNALYGGPAASLTLARGDCKIAINLIPDAVETDGYLLLVGRPMRSGAPEPFADLPITARERDVLKWGAAGKTNAEIAGLLGVSARTIEKHFEHIFDKLGVETRIAAVMRALGREPPGQG